MEEIVDRITQFKIDLGNKEYEDEEIVRRHIEFGTPFVFRDDEKLYYELKQQIAHYYGVRHRDVIMIGSAKLGFSIVPTKIWKYFDYDSDIDMVIISDRLFDQFWIDLYDFNISLTARTEREEELYRKFLEYFFKGWLRPDLFPIRFRRKNDWFDFFRDISYKHYGNRKITGAIFKNDHFFKKYHVNNIRNIRMEV